jgi:2-polyprenyl-3-methyl-5-hydroxy-6-metoxy-1,4-benzoquinol methylase
MITKFSCIQTVVAGCRDNSFYVHNHHGGVLGREGAVDQDFECCDVGCGGGDVAE